MRPLVILFMTLALAACASRAEKQAALDAEDIARCTELGFAPGTEQFGMCRLQQEQTRAQQQAGQAARVGAAMQGYNAASRPFFP